MLVKVENGHVAKVLVNSGDKLTGIEFTLIERANGSVIVSVAKIHSESPLTLMVSPIAPNAICLEGIYR